MAAKLDRRALLQPQLAVDVPTARALRAELARDEPAAAYARGEIDAAPLP